MKLMRYVPSVPPPSVVAHQLTFWPVPIALDLLIIDKNLIVPSKCLLLDSQLNVVLDWRRSQNEFKRPSIKSITSSYSIKKEIIPSMRSIPWRRCRSRCWSIAVAWSWSDNSCISNIVYRYVIRISMRFMGGSQRWSISPHWIYHVIGSEDFLIPSSNWFD